MEQAKKGDWIEIHQTVLPVGERAPQIPEETQKVPLELWVKGFLEDEKAAVGDTAKVRTLAGRLLEGKVTAIMPAHQITYGQPQPELLTIGHELRQRMGVMKHA